MHIEFLSILEVAAGKRHDFISNQGKALAHLSRMTVSTRDRLVVHFFSNQHTPLHYFQINTPTITLTFALFINRGHEKQSDSNTTSTSSSASASAVSADWDIAPPLRNVRVDTQYVGIIEEQKQQLKSLRKN